MTAIYNIRKYFFIFLLILLSTKGFSQKYLKGIVLDDKNIPIEGVLIHYKLNDNSTISNAEGVFEILKSNQKNDTLLFATLNCPTKKISLNKDNEEYIKVTLVSNTIALKEVVISTINAEKILDSIIYNFSKNNLESISYYGNYTEKHIKTEKIKNYLSTILQINIANLKVDKLLYDDSQSFKAKGRDYRDGSFSPILGQFIKDYYTIDFFKLVKKYINNFKINAYKSFYDGKDVFILLFKDKNDNSEYYRKLIIDTNNYAVIKFESYLPLNQIKRKDNTENELYVIPTTSKIEINFRNRNSKYILNSIIGKISGILFENDVQTSVSTSWSYVVENVCEEKCKLLNQKVKNNESIFLQTKSTQISINKNRQTVDEINFLNSTIEESKIKK